MTFKTEIRGMTFFRGKAAKNGVRRVALAEVYIPEMGMTLNGVQLTWSPERGFGAQSPSALIHGAVYAITWNPLKGEFARDLAAKLGDMYVRMGGTLPDQEEEPDPIATAKAGKIERRVFPAEFKIGTANGRPIAEAAAEADSLIAAMDDAADDASGLRAFLGVDAVSETMEQAGL